MHCSVDFKIASPKEVFKTCEGDVEIEVTVTTFGEPIYIKGFTDQNQFHISGPHENETLNVAVNDEGRYLFIGYRMNETEETSSSTTVIVEGECSNNR